MRSIKIVLLMLCWLPMAVFARAHEVKDVDVAVTEQLSAKQVGEAVRRALEGRRWIVSNAGASSLDAAQMTRGLVAKIRVSWDARTVSIKYLDSTGLDYKEEDGKRYIHGNYTKWISNLERDLPVFFARAAAAQ